MTVPRHIVFVESNMAGLDALATAKTMGCATTFVRAPHLTHLYTHGVQPPILCNIDRVVDVPDTTDPETLWQYVSALHRQHPIHAIITGVEYCAEAVAISAARFGLPGTNPQAVARARDKGLTRQCLRAAGLAGPNCVRAVSWEEVSSAATVIGYPLVMKPAHGTASFFASVVRNDDELHVAFEKFVTGRQILEPFLQSALGEGLLLEEYLVGRMLSAEIGTDGATSVVFAVCERKRYDQDETIELGTTMPATLSPDEHRAVTNYVADVLRVLGLDCGIFHLEVMLTDRGPVLIEANPRLIGGTGPWLLRHAFDFDIFESLIRIFTGESLDVLPLLPSRYAVSRLIASTCEATCPSDLQLGWLAEYQGIVAHWQLFVTSGGHIPRVRSNHDYIGSCVVTGPTAMAAERTADEIITRLSRTLGVALAQ